MTETFDFVVVGAGTAGCLLAERLTRSGRFRVLLLEAGGSDRRLMIRMPIGYGHSFYNPRVNWMYVTPPQEALAGRQSYWPRGKVLGGSSSINAMVYVRGQRRDFDDWAEAGNPGWGYDDVLPYFRAFERFHGGPAADDGGPATDDGGPAAGDAGRRAGRNDVAGRDGNSDRHQGEAVADGGERGSEGALDVTDAASSVHPLCEIFLAAAGQAGFSRTADYNGARQEGVAAYQMTTRNGVRASSATAFLRPAMRRRNLTVRTHATVSRLVLDGRRVLGVDYETGGRTFRVMARAEVILSAGAVASPAILQRSGIGPGPVVGAAGVAVAHELAAVGEHLQDHLGMDYLYEARVPTLNRALRSWTGRAVMGARYLAFRSGPFALSVNQAGGFVRSQPGLNAVDMQLYFSPVSYSRPTPGVRRLTLPDPFDGLMLGLSQCRPQSRGRIAITSSDPAAPPKIEPNYLSAPEDMEELVRGVEMLRRIAAQPALQAIIRREVAPGPDVAGRAALEADIRARAGSVFHASCTCRMGPDPRDAVVDARLRVHGLDGLRVIDASIFPNITSGNTNAPVTMVAEKGAAMVLADNT